MKDEARAERLMSEAIRVWGLCSWAGYQRPLPTLVVVSMKCGDERLELAVEASLSGQLLRVQLPRLFKIEIWEDLGVCNAFMADTPLVRLIYDDEMWVSLSMEIPAESLDNEHVKMLLDQLPELILEDLLPSLLVYRTQRKEKPRLKGQETASTEAIRAQLEKLYNK